MPSNHLILCHPLFLLPSIFSSIRVFSNESALGIRWPKYWHFSFRISPSNEHPGLISFRMDWLELLAVQGTLKRLLQHHSSKASILRHSTFRIVQLSHPYMTTGKTIALTRRTFVGKVMSLLFNMQWGSSNASMGHGKRLLNISVDFCCFIFRRPGPAIARIPISVLKFEKRKINKAQHYYVLLWIHTYAHQCIEICREDSTQQRMASPGKGGGQDRGLEMSEGTFHVLIIFSFLSGGYMYDYLRNCKIMHIVFIFYCCVTKYHKFSSLKQGLFINSQFYSGEGGLPLQAQWERIHVIKQETQVQSLGREEEMATYSSILAWRTPWSPWSHKELATT